MMLIDQRVHVYTDKNLLFSRISKNGFLFIIFFFDGASAMHTALLKKVTALRQGKA